MESETNHGSVDLNLCLVYQSFASNLLRTIYQMDCLPLSQVLIALLILASDEMMLLRLAN